MTGGEDPTRSANVFDRFLSYTAFVLLAAACAWFAWSIPRYQAAMRQIFVDFKLELPQMTNAALAVPAWVVYGVCAAFFVIGLIVQLARPARASTATFHLLFVFILGVAYFAFRDAMMQPMATLVGGISSPSR